MREREKKPVVVLVGWVLTLSTLLYIHVSEKKAKALLYKRELYTRAVRHRRSSQLNFSKYPSKSISNTLVHFFASFGPITGLT